MGAVTLSLIQDLSDTLAGLLLSFEPQHDDLRHVESIVAAYTDSLERMLGAPETSLQFVDAEMLKEWFVSSQDNV